MKTTIITFCAFMVSIAATNAADVDWKYYVAAENKQHCFYDAQGVSLQSVGHPRVWTKCLDEGEIEAATASERDDIAKLTAKKIVEGYLPPMVKVFNFPSFDPIIAVVQYETAANVGYLKPTVTVYWELNCSEKMIRMLQLSARNGNSCNAVEARMELCRTRNKRRPIVEDGVPLREISSMANCPVCTTSNTSRQPGADFARFDCSRCGSFILSGTAESTLEGKLAEAPLRRSLMSHTLRRMQLPNDKHLRIITDDELPTFWSEGRLPTPIQQANNLILFVGDNQRSPSAWAEASGSVIAAMVGIEISSGGDSQGWGWLHKELEPEGLYRLHPGFVGGKVGLMLTMDGWKKYEELRETEDRKSHGVYGDEV